MPSKDTAIDTSALVPAIWSARMQIPLTKSLVALEVCSTDLQAELKVGDTIHKGYMGVLSAVTYTPGNALTAQNYTATDDTILVQTMKAVPFYVNHLRTLGETLLIKFRKLRENLIETIRSEVQKWERSETIIGIS